MLIAHDTNLLLSATNGSTSICGQGVVPAHCWEADTEVEESAPAAVDWNTPQTAQMVPAYWFAGYGSLGFGMPGQAACLHGAACWGGAADRVGLVRIVRLGSARVYAHGAQRHAAAGPAASGRVRGDTFSYWPVRTPARVPPVRVPLSRCTETW
jgi:hypothetical protein